MCLILVFPVLDRARRLFHNMVVSFCFFCFTVAFVLFFAVVCKKAVNAAVATNWYKKCFAWFHVRFGALIQDFFEPTKREMFGRLKENLQNVPGDVLEIGIGGGANSLFYPPGTSLVALDPNPFNEQLLRENIKKLSPNVYLKRYIVASSEDMRPEGVAEIEDKTMAAVVCTYLLCSLTETQIQKTLQEVKRVLKPGGRFFFLEHIIDKPGTLRHYIQKLVELLGIWAFLFDGCHLDRQTWRYLDEAGFKSVSYKQFCLKPLPEKWSLKAHIALYITAWNLGGYAEM